ncbi:TIGR03084 family protein [Rhodococcus sp. BP-252]|uniref:TIGR03084 family metal-binding protein n=1 Tax=unclassified Rhodococcus (in: high G+C Gram-positive bacteria) TaxID=192944 RepID=UPI001C9B3E66|nr:MULTISPECIES: TIGR03084 family metal-binding protein [unclassified Rhodococcus (in: high G+C Gram-positive bacteria)]MBY6411768.1 TIGR03084 family protein [Rhodococcus sp. BP-320]MBY6417247.1 TIGR03084 family protein [Rhodococcus sp. BP-321]MBY6421968.1 TIGR03084 family protein [Rhodococcus sp. BP-324]MBY6427271.1 TIGR03084 family protein [Rhodococcus sp. BP-323]MBY6432586.1 TIGR03084 family protein [Rhodococcus sp. BP-322]
MADLDSIVDDLRAEGDALDALVADLDQEQWSTPTPAAGWTIAHQIGHLSWTDNVAERTTSGAAGDADAAAEFDVALKQAWADPTGFVDAAADEEAAKPDLLTTWRTRRHAMTDALAKVPARVKIPWFGPPMSAASMATARLMETWAHGQDVADALGIVREPTDRIKGVAHIGVRTRDFAYAVNQQTPPAEPFRVELTSPLGELWTWGPEDASQRVTGSAADFCLLVTQRAHRDDLDLTAVGDDAQHWLTIAQAFAGPPGSGRDKR